MSDRNSRSNAGGPRRGFGNGVAIGLFIGLLLGLALPSVLFIGLPAVSEYVSRTTFDSAKWKEQQGSDAVRLRMVDDLLKRFRLVGMSRNEIDELLGKPPPTTYFADYEYVYWLGPERGYISIDSEWLGLKFSNDVVTEADLLRD